MMKNTISNESHGDNVLRSANLAKRNGIVVLNVRYKFNILLDPKKKTG